MEIGRARNDAAEFVAFGTCSHELGHRYENLFGKNMSERRVRFFNRKFLFLLGVRHGGEAVHLPAQEGVAGGNVDAFQAILNIHGLHSSCWRPLHPLCEQSAFSDRFWGWAPKNA